MVDVNDARRERAELREHIRSVADVAAREERRLTDEERTAVERSRARVGVLSETIEYQDYLRDLDEATAVVTEPTATGLAVREVRPPARVAVQTMAHPSSSHTDARALFPTDERYTRAFEAYIRRGFGGMSGEEREVLMANFSGGMETRAMGTTSAAAGGALIPQEFYAKLFEAMKAIGGVRQSRATVMQTGSGAPMPIPLVDDTANVGALLAENTQITAQDYTFAQKTLNSYVYTSKLVLVSFQMLQDAFFDIEGWLARSLGTRVARAVNAHFTTGTGTAQPEGVVTGAQSGVVAASGNTVTITYDNLVNMIHAVDPAYRDNAEWMFNDATLKIIRQLKDSQNRPLWQQDMALGVRPTILGYPYVINQDMAVMAANAKSILFGDFSYYLIREVQDLRVLRLDERYADFLQVGFFAFARTDGITANPGGATQAPIKFYQNSAT